MLIDTANPLFAPYFDGLDAGELRFPRCDDCDRFHWYPKVRCPWCSGAALDWVPVARDGTLFSWTTVWHAFTTEFRNRVPYTVGLIEFPSAPGVRLVTRVTLTNGEEACCGLPVRAVLPSKDDGDRLVTVVPASGPSPN